MPTSRYDRVLKVQFKPKDAEKEHTDRTSSSGRKTEKSEIKRRVSSFSNLKPPRSVTNLPSKMVGRRVKNIRRLKNTDHAGAKPKVKFLSLDSVLRSRDLALSKMPLRASSILAKNVQGSNIIEGILQKPDLTEPFLSLKTSRERVKKRKEFLRQSVPRAFDSENRHLSHQQTLQLLRELKKEPLPFLELRSRLDVSKQTIKRFVRNGFLKEVWGPKAVGVRFALSIKGISYLAGLEAAAKYRPNAQRNAIIRLKQTTTL